MALQVEGGNTSSVTDSKYLSDPEGETALSGPGVTGWVNGVWMADMKTGSTSLGPLSKI